MRKDNILRITILVVSLLLIVVGIEFFVSDSQHSDVVLLETTQGVVAMHVGATEKEVCFIFKGKKITLQNHESVQIDAQPGELVTLYPSVFGVGILPWKKYVRPNNLKEPIDDYLLRKNQNQEGKR